MDVARRRYAAGLLPCAVRGSARLVNMLGYSTRYTPGLPPTHKPLLHIACACHGGWETAHVPAAASPHASSHTHTPASAECASRACRDLGGHLLCMTIRQIHKWQSLRCSPASKAVRLLHGLLWLRGDRRAWQMNAIPSTLEANRCILFHTSCAAPAALVLQLAAAAAPRCALRSAAAAESSAVL